MHEEIDDFEPDMRSFYNMDPEERRLRKAKYKLYLRYNSDKISYVQYLEELDAHFFEVLDENETKEIKKHKKEKYLKEVVKTKAERERILVRKKQEEESKKTFAYFFIAILIIAFLFGLLKK